MLKIKKKYLTDEDNNPVAVQIDIRTYHQIEELLEDYALSKYIDEVVDEETMNVNEAKAYYKK